MALPLPAAQAQTFLTVPVNLSNTGNAAVPTIAAGPSGDINVAWLDSGAILFRRSVDGGQTVSATMTVATTDLPSPASPPQIAVNSAGAYVAWAGPSDVFFSSLPSDASSWVSAVNVSGGMGIASSGAPVPHMAVDPSGGVDIVWGQNGAFFRRFFNGTFSSAIQLTAGTMASESPRIAINDVGHVFVVWENAANCPTITFARSINGGATFADYSVADNLAVNGQPVTGCTSDVQIAIGASNTIHLLWANENTQIQDLISTYATDTDQAFSGSNFPETAFQNLSTTASHTPHMASDSSGNIDVVWIGDFQQNGAPEAVYFTRSTSGGNSFANPLPLTAPPAPGAKATASPQIAVEPSGAIDLIWQQASAANPDNAYDIILARSTDGSTFAKATLNNAPTTQGGTGQIAADTSGNVYAVWQGSSGSGGDVLLNGDSAGLITSVQFSLSGVKVSVSPLSAVINVGGSASFSLSVSSTNSVSGAVTLACGGAPAGVSCSFNPNPVTLAPNGSASATLSVSISAKPSASAAARYPGQSFGRRLDGLLPVAAWMWGVAFAMAFAVLMAARRVRDTAQFPRALALTLLLGAVATAMVSCGGSTHTGGGGGSMTFPLMLQAQTNSGTASMQTISVTVP